MLHTGSGGRDKRVKWLFTDETHTRTGTDHFGTSRWVHLGWVEGVMLRWCKIRRYVNYAMGLSVASAHHFTAPNAKTQMRQTEYANKHQVRSVSSAAKPLNNLAIVSALSLYMAMQYCHTVQYRCDIFASCEITGKEAFMHWMPCNEQCNTTGTLTNGYIHVAYAVAHH